MQFICGHTLDGILQLVQVRKCIFHLNVYACKFALEILNTWRSENASTANDVTLLKYFVEFQIVIFLYGNNQCKLLFSSCHLKL